MKMEKHREVTQWAIAKGVKINGFAPLRFPGRWFGIIAERRFVGRGTGWEEKEEEEDEEDGGERCDAILNPSRLTPPFLLSHCLYLGELRRYLKA
jgi:hypothetical protein